MCPDLSQNNTARLSVLYISHIWIINNNNNNNNNNNMIWYSECD